MAMKKFKYNVKDLLNCVRERPCLWDRSLESYRDKVERRTAWEEIFKILDENYEQMSPEEQHWMGEGVIYKWTNIRDTFMKTLKTQVGKQKRPYMFHNELTFLKKNFSDGEYNEEGGYIYMKQEVENDAETDDSVVRKKSKISVGLGPKKDSRKRKRNADESFSAKSDDIDYVEHVEIESDPRTVMNEDEAFFASLLPTVVKYDDDDKLDFRLGVLEVMKRIKEKKWTIVQE
ncbi:uncharacterized protein LOC128680225 [Plodia interpunctella]|uniref:uncharacterized protein LOC128680225 n=1 Tax=Plodia interpunctella TaxID=58824 RepID=UPI0023682129|nr:uncharacterized protein LOC128680225 [Plodia interpunctella]